MLIAEVARRWLRLEAVTRPSMRFVPIKSEQQQSGQLGRNPGSGLIAASDIFIVGAREALLKSAEAHRVPVISPYRQFVIEGSLMSYGPDTTDIFRRSSSYVDRILKGESPSNLPVQSPTKFEFVFNLKTAKALGLSVRSSILQLNDEVIE